MVLFPHTHHPATPRYILVGSNTMTHKLAEEVAGLYPGGRVRRPLFFVPKWLVWLLAPAVGLPRDAVTVGAVGWVVGTAWWLAKSGAAHAKASPGWCGYGRPRRA